MHKIKPLLFLLFLLPLHLLSENEECYLRIAVKSIDDVSKLSQLVSIDREYDALSGGKYFLAYTGTDNLPILKKLGYQFKRLPHPGINPGVRMGLLSRAKNRAWDAFPTYQEYAQMMQDFASNYPDICRLYNIGASTNTSRPHDLWVLKISEDPDTEQDEPEIFYTSTMHGDETTGYVTMLHLIDELLTHYDPASVNAYDMEITAMIQSMEIWINPLANPDGTYQLNDTTVSGATRSFTTTTGGYSGVDPNRNFPDPDGGPHPDGSPYWAETTAMMNFADQNHFVLSINFHGGAEVMNYPWDTWARLHADNDWFVDVCRAYADQAQADSTPGYFTQYNNGITNGYAWYEVEGGRQDYMNYWQGCRETTNEISGTKNPSGSSLPFYWDSNRQALLNYFKESLKGIRGIVTSQSGSPLAATIEIVGYDVELDQSTVRTDPAVGDYHRMLPPGTYTIRASAYGFLPQEFSNITVLEGDATLQDFTLQPASTVSISGIITSSPGDIPLAGATVELLNTPVSPVLTGPDGTYSFPNIIEGMLTFRVSANDHHTIEEEKLVTVSNSVQDFSLPRITTSLFINFESNDGGLSGDGTWTYGTPSGNSPSAYSGSYLWATNLSGDYANNEHSYLQIDDILVPADFAEFSFRHWYQFENSYDGGRVELATSGGSFMTLTPTKGYPGNVNSLSSDGYNGSSSNWLLAVFDISAYAEQTISIRWHFASDSTVANLGWYIDDLRVTGQEESDVIFFDGFEAGDTRRWSHTAAD